MFIVFLFLEGLRVVMIILYNDYIFIIKRRKKVIIYRSFIGFYDWREGMFMFVRYVVVYCNIILVYVFFFLVSCVINYVFYFYLFIMCLIIFLKSNRYGIYGL